MKTPLKLTSSPKKCPRIYSYPRVDTKLVQQTASVAGHNLILRGMVGGEGMFGEVEERETGELTRLFSSREMGGMAGAAPKRSLDERWAAAGGGKGGGRATKFVIKTKKFVRSSGIEKAEERREGWEAHNLWNVLWKNDLKPRISNSRCHSSASK